MTDIGINPLIPERYPLLHNLWCKHSKSECISSTWFDKSLISIIKNKE